MSKRLMMIALFAAMVGAANLAEAARGFRMGGGCANGQCGLSYAPAKAAPMAKAASPAPSEQVVREASATKDVVVKEANAQPVQSSNSNVWFPRFRRWR